MAPSRRVLLRSAGLVLAGLGGCAAGYEPPPHPEPEECPDSPRMPDADPHPDGADLPPVPDPPAELDEASAVAYAEAFELAREWRATTATYDGPVTKVRTEATARASRVDDETVLVELPAVTPSGRVAFEGNVDESGHFDGWRYSASYLVTTEAVWRAESERGSEYPPPPDPVDDGRVVVCFESPRQSLGSRADY